MWVLLKLVNKNMLQIAIAKKNVFPLFTISHITISLCRKRHQSNHSSIALTVMTRFVLLPFFVCLSHSANALKKRSQPTNLASISSCAMICTRISYFVLCVSFALTRWIQYSLAQILKIPWAKFNRGTVQYVRVYYSIASTLSSFSVKWMLFHRYVLCQPSSQL